VSSDVVRGDLRFPDGTFLPNFVRNVPSQSSGRTLHLSDISCSVERWYYRANCIRSPLYEVWSNLLKLQLFGIELSTRHCSKEFSLSWFLPLVKYILCSTFDSFSHILLSFPNFFPCKGSYSLSLSLSHSFLPFLNFSHYFLVATYKTTCLTAVGIHFHSC
jgi:hypothetical protein